MNRGHFFTLFSIKKETWKLPCQDYDVVLFKIGQRGLEQNFLEKYSSLIYFLILNISVKTHEQEYFFQNFLEI